MPRTLLALPLSCSLVSTNQALCLCLSTRGALWTKRITTALPLLWLLVNFSRRSCPRSSMRAVLWTKRMKTGPQLLCLFAVISQASCLRSSMRAAVWTSEEFWMDGCSRCNELQSRSFMLSFGSRLWCEFWIQRTKPIAHRNSSLQRLHPSSHWIWLSIQQLCWWRFGLIDCYSSSNLSHSNKTGTYQSGFGSRLSRHCNRAVISSLIKGITRHE